MARATWIAGGLATIAIAAAAWLALENRRLRAQIAARPAPVAVAATGDDDPSGSTRPGASDAGSAVASALGTGRSLADGPALPAAPKETRLERRTRRTEEIAAMFGRLENETDAEYQERVGAMIEVLLSKTRANVKDMRMNAEAIAGVTPEQSAQLDAAFTDLYDDVLDYANSAVASGQVSPYERNVAGLLEFAGGLGGLLAEAEGAAAKVLRPEQQRALEAAGFEWGEYLGAVVPWERINPPPPPPK